MPEPFLDAADLAFTVAGRDLGRDVTLTVGPGTVQIVVGPNGADGSILLRVLCGELRPRRGRVAYGGEAVEHIPPWRLAGMRAVLP